jgi:hypothetical protein
MADYLVYWKTYKIGESVPSFAGGSWATTSKAFYSRVRKGDRIWVVVTAGKRAPKEWRLLAQFTVEKRGTGKTPYGELQMYARAGSSRAYKLDPQPDLAAILRLLSFRGGKRIRVKGGAIGNALQSNGYRALSEKDADVLMAYAATLGKS